MRSATPWRRPSAAASPLARCHVAAVVALLLLLLMVRETQAQANPVQKPIVFGNNKLYTRKFAKIPDWKGKPSKIVGIVPLGKNLFVTTSTSGALIYRISGTGVVSRWFDVDDAIRRKGSRGVSFDNVAHGGLRGLAFHPRFWQNGFFYVSFMERRPWNYKQLRYLSRPNNAINADSVVAEFRANGLWPVKSSYRPVLRIGMKVYDHPIKQITFMWNNLLIAHGDGSVQSAVTGGGQANDGLGKILRINPLKSGNKPYTIPDGNPFRVNKKMLPEIFASGFRNPHNLCFSRKTGLLYVADAGRDNVEEINIVRKGANYGWSEREGTFVHREAGGLGLGQGVSPLPWNDAKYGYTYPAAQLGHTGPRGARFIGQAIAGSCPVENGSLLNGKLLYANFPGRGEIYYSNVWELRRAVTKGRPRDLTQARTFQMRILYDHDNNKKTAPKQFTLLRDIVRQDFPHRNTFRTDMRFGVGSDGTLYWSSKTNGQIYVISNSEPKWRP